MKNSITVPLLASVFFITSCGNHENVSKEEKPNAAETPASASAANGEDSIALTKLVRAVYKWEDTEGQGSDFDPKEVEGDSLYRGIDWEAYNKRVKMLKATNYFDQRFFDSHKQVARYIDTALKSGREEWPKGDLPSFGYDVSPWCNCQDAPIENAWKILTIANLKIENGQADFSWTWGENFLYKIKAVKENGAWKISYLEGFRPENWMSGPSPKADEYFNH
jgi:hypothetical protein